MVCRRDFVDDLEARDYVELEARFGGRGGRGGRGRGGRSPDAGDQGSGGRCAARLALGVVCKESVD